MITGDGSMNTGDGSIITGSMNTGLVNTGSMNTGSLHTVVFFWGLPLSFTLLCGSLVLPAVSY